MNLTQLLTRTTPHATALHGQADVLHIIPNCPLDLHTVSYPFLVAMDFVIHQHWSVIFQDSGDGAFQQRTQGQPFAPSVLFEATADRIAGSPNATHCAISASTQMFHGIGS